MQRKIRLLGPPSVMLDGRLVDPPHGRKPWALLTYLALATQPPSRSKLIGLLFPEPLDPPRALRWNLTELRRLLGDAETVGGDPLELRLDAGDDLDVHQVLSRSRPRPMDIAALGGELLEGLTFDDTPGFAAWLDLERHHLRAATEALLTELALDGSNSGDHAVAASLALRAIELDELNAEHHALLVSSLVAMGDIAGARAHVARCGGLYQEALGTSAPAVIQAALLPAAKPQPVLSLHASLQAALEAARAAISAGAIAYGVAGLRQAAALAVAAPSGLRAEVLLELGSALLHSTGDRSPASASCLQEAYRRAETPEIAAHAARELAFLQVQLGQRERADAWLDRATQLPVGPGERSRILAIRGMNRSDAGRYDESLTLLEESVRLADEAGHVRSSIWSLSLIGRIHLLRDELGKAAQILDGATAMVAHEHWTAFSPWVEALRAELLLRRGEVDEAAQGIERSYALSCTLGDHCWISMNARAMALVRAALGDQSGALSWVEESLRPTPWYLWVQAHALATGVSLAQAAGDPRAAAWAAELKRLAGRAQLAIGAQLHAQTLPQTP